MIRKAKKEDAKKISPLILVILKDMELPLLEMVSEEQLLRILSEAFLEADYRYGYRRAIVYEDHGEIAGVAFSYPSEEEKTIDKPLETILQNYDLPEGSQLFIDPETLPNEWYLDSISVDRNYRGQGIGTELLRALPTMAKKEGKSIISLNVDHSNPKAKKLYEREGFEKVGEMTLSGHLYDHMHKKI